ncbi:3-oxoacyl-[acyl-carrier-protein] synthase II [Verrucomicrobium sp. GAS474]|uniref:beta-ketoacyl-[acyl-carrier-protein] synthase family protein n=1 Tax=Verrucomicrobium sp. GAS474 TaxID=1882831 RepID=UPI000879C6F4|nr:beta-ketoacyl-[acyl-carrier-protein] synthase family protein [Verrucomicrobium sp. GAS474]SDU05098.1 3-oxoacyl-[acyl-carrier-protein] synthase II [Verrucomicrobium sp. GAS474]
MKKVVVTGMGMVSPLGPDTETTWRAILSGASARGPVDLFETEGCRCREAAQVPLSLPPPAPGSKKEQRLSRASRLALLAAGEALRHAALPAPVAAAIPLSLSTTGGAMEWGEHFLRRALAGSRTRKLAQLARYQPQQQVLDLRQAFGLGGPSTLMANACASGANAIGHGFDLIQCGMAECVLVGGYEALAELIFVGFDCLQSLSGTRCRPFDLNRDGLMLGEGAAFLVLESEAHALARGAARIGSILGYGQALDLHHLTQPAPAGTALIAAMRSALKGASLPPEAISYVNAHGTGTPMNDGSEAAAYAEVFGPALARIAVSSTKAAIGHTLGAAGSIEACLALLTARDGTPPPQLFNETPLPEMAASLALTHASAPLKPGPVMSVNLGFGGSNAALVLGP